MSSVANIALGGIHRGLSQLDSAAQQVATGEGELATQFVELQQASSQIELNAQVIRVADEMVGTLIDLLL